MNWFAFEPKQKHTAHILWTQKITTNEKKADFDRVSVKTQNILKRNKIQQPFVVKKKKTKKKESLALIWSLTYAHTHEYA